MDYCLLCRLASGSPVIELPCLAMKEHTNHSIFCHKTI